MTATTTTRLSQSSAIVIVWRSRCACDRVCVIADHPIQCRYYLDEYSKLTPAQRPLEIIMNAGDLIYVPSG
jgi:hypothetical protein